MAGMTPSEALMDISSKLTRLNGRQRRLRLPAIEDLDETWDERVHELQARIVLLMADGPSQDVLDALGAHVVAFKVALARAEEVSVASGEAA